jgi:hypothetical protein
MMFVKQCLMCRKPHERIDRLCADCRVKETRRYRARSLKAARTKARMKAARAAANQASAGGSNVLFIIMD